MKLAFLKVESKMTEINRAERKALRLLEGLNTALLAWGFTRINNHWNKSRVNVWATLEWSNRMEWASLNVTVNRHFLKVVKSHLRLKRLIDKTQAEANSFIPGETHL